MHPRRNILEKIKNILIDKTDAESRVFLHRVNNISIENLPAISVKVMRESANIFSDTKRTYKRKLSVDIAILAQSSEDVQEITENVAQQVESVILLNETLDDLVEDTQITDTDLNIETGNTDIGSSVLSFEVTYYTDHIKSFDDFVTAGVDIKNGNSNDSISSSVISIPQ